MKKSKKKQKNGVKTEVDASCDMFTGISSNGKHELAEDTSDANNSNGRVTDRLLEILMDKTKKMELDEETKENDEKNENKNLENSKLKNMIYKLYDQVCHLTNMHTAAIEQNARLAQEVNDLKQMKSCCNTQPFTMSNNPRCAANFCGIPQENKLKTPKDFCRH